jgi:hypothetical protein
VEEEDGEARVGGVTDAQCVEYGHQTHPQDASRSIASHQISH